MPAKSDGQCSLFELPHVS